MKRTALLYIRLCSIAEIHTHFVGKRGLKSDTKISGAVCQSAAREKGRVERETGFPPRGSAFYDKVRHG